MLRETDVAGIRVYSCHSWLPKRTIPNPGTACPAHGRHAGTRLRNQGRPPAASNPSLCVATASRYQRRLVIRHSSFPVHQGRPPAASNPSLCVATASRYQPLPSIHSRPSRTPATSLRRSSNRSLRNALARHSYSLSSRVSRLRRSNPSLCVATASRYQRCLVIRHSSFRHQGRPSAASTLVGRTASGNRRRLICHSFIPGPPGGSIAVRCNRFAVPTPPRHSSFVIPCPPG